MNWPRGKYNGRRIGGFAVRFEFNLTHISWCVIWKSYCKSVHAGPVHVWIEAVYEML